MSRLHLLCVKPIVLQAKRVPCMLYRDVGRHASDGNLWCISAVRWYAGHNRWFRIVHRLNADCVANSEAFLADFYDLTVLMSELIFKPFNRPRNDCTENHQLKIGWSDLANSKKSSSSLVNISVHQIEQGCHNSSSKFLCRMANLSRSCTMFATLRQALA